MINPPTKIPPLQKYRPYGAGEGAWACIDGRCPSLGYFAPTGLIEGHWPVTMGDAHRWGITPLRGLEGITPLWGLRGADGVEALKGQNI